jgi:hypothetical protein
MFMSQITNKEAILRILPTDRDNAIALADLARTLNARTGNVRYYLVRMQEDGLVDQLANRRWVATPPENEETPDEETLDNEEIEVVVPDTSEFGITSLSDGSVSVHDTSNLDIPQTLMEIVKHLTHLATLFARIEADVDEALQDVSEVQEAFEEEPQYCGTEEFIADEPSRLDELIADMDARLPEISILRDVVYDPNDYKEVLGRLWSSNIYLKNVIALYEEVGNKRFIKDQAKSLFSSLYDEYMLTQPNDTKVRLLRRKNSTIKNTADLTLSYLRKTGCISVNKNGFYKFKVSPIELFEITTKRPA